jgi:hypothetical protein
MIQILHHSSPHFKFKWESFYILWSIRCSFVDLNSSKTSCVTTLSIYNSVACKLSYVCYYYCSKCCKCCSLFGTLVSCSSLTSCLCSLNCHSYGDVIRGTSYLYSFNYVFCGVVICGISIICLATCTIVGTTNGSTLPLIIFYAFRFVFSYSLFTLKPKAFP